MDVIKNIRIHVAPTRDEAIADARLSFEHGGLYVPSTFEEFLATSAVGTPEECVQVIENLRGYGVTYLRSEFGDAAHQAQVAKLLLPLVAKLPPS